MPDWRAATRRAAIKHGLDPDVFERQINQESGFNPNARSPAGALGIAQFMPATARGVGVDPLDPLAALDASAKLMKGYVDKFGSMRDALVAYNAGPGAVGRPLPAETQNYIKTILGGTSGGTSRQASAGATSPDRYRTVTKTTPGVDNRGARAQLILSFLGGSNPDPLYFASQVKQLQDVAPKTTTSRVRIPGATMPGTTSEGTGGNLHGSEVKELIYNDGGKGFGIKNGAEVDGPQFYSAVWAGHANHVHVAAGPETVVALGKIAQQMGLHVGENPHFGGVDPVHVPGSYHYKGEAIDVSGDPAKRRKFAEYVKRYSDAHA